MDPLIELLLELGTRAKQAERTVAAQAERIKELETMVAKLTAPNTAPAAPVIEEKEH